MSVKYYTHFLMQEPRAGLQTVELQQGLSEFRGVVEVNRSMRRGDFREAAVVLARNFECDVKDIRVLQWSRLH
ncbi:MAG: hypothetical protein QM800_06835 [Paludibacter sp.]